jgi:predicted nucleic acid-binding protein
LILLDTNIAIDLRDVDLATLEQVARLQGTLAMSAVTWIELESGVARDPALTSLRRTRLDELLSDLDVIHLEADDIRAYGRMVATLGFNRARTLDRLIAAQCLTRRASLVTRNARDFREVEGLSLIEW